MGQSGSRSGTSGTSSSGGFWSELKDIFVSDEDRHSYEEGVRRGGYLLTAHVDESRANEACYILERGGSVDFDSREQSMPPEDSASTLAAACVRLVRHTLGTVMPP